MGLGDEHRRPSGKDGRRNPQVGKAGILLRNAVKPRQVLKEAGERSEVHRRIGDLRTSQEVTPQHFRQGCVRQGKGGGDRIRDVRHGPAPLTRQRTSGEVRDALHAFRQARLRRIRTRALDERSALIQRDARETAVTRMTGGLRQEPPDVLTTLSRVRQTERTLNRRLRHRVLRDGQQDADNEMGRYQLNCAYENNRPQAVRTQGAGSSQGLHAAP